MAITKVSFTPEAANNIKRAAQQVLATPTNGRGHVSTRRPSADRSEFWIKLTGNGAAGGSIGQFQYAWTEQQVNSGPAFADFPSSQARSGTLTGPMTDGTDLGPAVNVATTGVALANGTFVKAELTFDDSTPAKPVVLFDLQFMVGQAIRVNLSSDGGATGTQTTQPTWTYTATMIDGTALVGGLSPEWPRPNGNYNAASAGIGYFNTSGVFKLSIAFEWPGTSPCST